VIPPVYNTGAFAVWLNLADEIEGVEPSMVFVSS
jgi:hypothetical protein